MTNTLSTEEQIFSAALADLDLEGKMSLRDSYARLVARAMREDDATDVDYLLARFTIADEAVDNHTFL